MTRFSPIRLNVYAVRLLKIQLALLTCFTLCVYSHAHANNSNAYYIEQAQTALEQSDYSRLRESLKKLELHSLTPRLEVQANLLNAFLYLIDGDYLQAQSLLSQELAYTPFQQIRRLYLSSHLSMMQGKYIVSFKNLDQMLGLLTADSELKARFWTSQLASSLYLAVNEHEKALEFAKQTLVLAKQGKALRPICFARGSLTQIYLAMKSWDLAEKANQQMQHSCELANEPLLFTSGIKHQAIIAFNRGQTARALALFREALESQNNQKYYLDNLEIKAYLAELLWLNLDSAEAEALANEVLVESDKINNFDTKLRAISTLSGIYEDTHQLDKALKYQKLKVDILERQMQQKQSRMLAYMKTKFETEEKNKQIQQLTQQHELILLDARLTRESSRDLFLLTIAIASVLAMVSLSLLRNMRQKQKFQRLAQTDSLTGIANRRHAFMQAKQCMRQKADDPFAVIIFDIDHFKKINDTYGHAIGDWVLQSVTQACQKVLRQNDIFGRIGGEEFAIFLPQSNAHMAMQLAQRCRLTIANMVMEDEHCQLQITASFGVAIRQGRKLPLEQLLRQADRALYQAKSTGRNKVCQYHAAEEEASKSLSRVLV